MSLKERREILALAQNMPEGVPAGVLVTMVRSAGSSYRRPGAHLLALPDGRTAGTISGGCLEADLLRKAQWRVREGAVVQSYDTGFDDLAEIPFGLGCGGAVDLLLENAATPEAAALLSALQDSLNGQERTLVTELPAGEMPLRRIVLDSRGDVLFASEHLHTEDVLPLRRAGVLRRSNEQMYVEHLAPAQRLLVLGAGEDAKPLVRIAAELGWTVVVADGRSQQAQPDRFPQAHAVRVARSANEAGVLPTDAVVVMTHSFEQDRAFLTGLLPLRPRYVGLLGARHRSALLLHQAASAAGLTLAEALQRVHAPVGFELGGDGPESIALAIVAEVLFCLGEANEAKLPGQRCMSFETAEACLQQFNNHLDMPQVCALDRPHEDHGSIQEAVL